MTLKAKIKLDPRVELRIRRTLAGDMLILDHEDIDIVLMAEKKKCITFPKDTMSDKVYASQDRMFRMLAKRGIVSHDSIRGGNVFGSMEAEIQESKVPGIESNQAFLYAIYEYITEEKPYFKSAAEYDDSRLDSLLSPSDEDSTELGDVPQDTTKGANAQVRPYGFMYNYSLVREDKEDT
jgi:hypothetical protein